MARWSLLLTILLAGCCASEVAPTPATTNVPEELALEIPNWKSDSLIAAICSRVSPANQQLLFIALDEMLTRESDSYQNRLSSLEEIIATQRGLLRDTIHEAPIMDTTSEENFIYYCANALIQLEMLRLQQLHREDLRKIGKSMDAVAESFNRLGSEDSSNQ